MTKAQKYRIRYQMYRELGYTPTEARQLRTRTLDVSPVQFNKKTGNIIKGKAYRNIRDSYPRANAVDKFRRKAWEVEKDTVYSRWGMLTHDDRYKDNTAKIVKYLQNRHKISNDQAYYFLYYMTVNKVPYRHAQIELLSSRDFEMYVSRSKRRIKK